MKRLKGFFSSSKETDIETALVKVGTQVEKLAEICELKFNHISEELTTIKGTNSESLGTLKTKIELVETDFKQHVDFHNNFYKTVAKNTGRFLLCSFGTIVVGVILIVAKDSALAALILKVIG